MEGINNMYFSKPQFWGFVPALLFDSTVSHSLLAWRLFQSLFMNLCVVRNDHLKLTALSGQSILQKLSLLLLYGLERENMLAPARRQRPLRSHSPEVWRCAGTPGVGWNGTNLPYHVSTGR